MQEDWIASSQGLLAMTAGIIQSGKYNAIVLQWYMPAKRKSVVAPRPVRPGYIRVRIDAKLKKSAETTLDKIGLSITDAVVIFFKQLVAQKRLPDELKVPNRESMKALRELEHGGGESFRGTPEELFAHILGKKRR